MSTRHLVVVALNNKYKVAQYGHFDGYPEYCGINIVKFIKNNIKMESYENDLQNIKDIFNNVVFLTDEDIDKIVKIDCNCFDNIININYDDIESSSNILNIIVEKKGNIMLENNLKFAKDSLFCEWCWVIDLDKELLECYKGFNKIPLTEDDRFYNVNSPKDNGFYPIKLFKLWNIRDILVIDDTKFINECYKQ